MAAEQGDSDAQSYLAGMYRNGRGVPQDAAEAERWNRLAAENGDPGAQYSLGLWYDSGGKVPRG